MSKENQTPVFSTAHSLFIAEMIATGNRRMAYQAAYPNTGNASARTNACRLLSKPDIARAVREGLLEIKMQALQTVKEKYEGRLADIDEKRAVLAQIIRGEAITERETTKEGKTQLTRIKGDTGARLRAIALDNKMEEEWNQIIELPDNGVRHME
jgi:phage terminase small subunit